MAYQRHKPPNKTWLAIERWFFKYKYIFWVIVYCLFFFVFPFFTTEHVDIMDLP
jgi:hypothetical protein